MPELSYPLPKFNAWRKIPRLLSPVTVSEKIDGTNAVIYVPQEASSPLVAGRRNDWLRPGEPDNYGFRAFVETNQETLRQLGPGLHFGEWYGQGIQRNYGLNHRRFALFDTSTVLTPDVRALHVEIVPVLFTFDNFDTGAISGALKWLEFEGSQAVPGWRKPEGIVVRHEKSGRLFKWPFDPEPKGERK